MQMYFIKLKNIIKESSEIVTYQFECPEDFTWEEGSNTHLGMPGFNTGDKPNRSLVHHMSINTVPSERLIGITTRIKETCSEYKTVLKNLVVGDEVAIFKTHSHMQLRRENKKIYLLSSGVGLATFRSLVLTYLDDGENISSVYSLNVDSSETYLYSDIVKSNEEKSITAQFVNSRDEYYNTVKKLAMDKDGIFYVVGSDEFLLQNIEILRGQGILDNQIILDKRKEQLEQFLSI